MYNFGWILCTSSQNHNILKNTLISKQHATMAAAMPAVADEASDEDDWRFPQSHDYLPYLLHFMSFLDDRLDNPYPKETTFSKERLLAIHPRHISRWMNFRAYGVVNPSEDAIVTGYRANSLLKAKQAISFYMPNKHVAWIDGTGGNPSCGNPTRHRSIAQIIKKVKKKECRGQGVKPNDKRAYTKEEFNKVLELFRAEADWDHQYKYPMMMLWAYHLIHRLDDTCHFHVDAPHSCAEFPLPFKPRPNGQRMWKLSFSVRIKSSLVPMTGRHARYFGSQCTLMDG